MTTTVKVNSHAGWPVLVTITQYSNADRLAPQAVTVTQKIVPPNTIADFYIHSHQDIAMREIQPEDSKR